MQSIRKLLLHSVICGSIALTAAAVSLCAYAEADSELHPGWCSSGQKRFYYLEDGLTPASGELEIDGVTYLFAPNGAQQTGWQTVDGKRYYYDPESGEAVFGRLIWRGEEYFITPETGKAVGITETAEGTVFGSEEGILQTGWQEAEGNRYFFGEDAAALCGLQEIDGAAYYFDDKGRMQTGHQKVGEQEYYFDDETGVQISGWYTDDEGSYYISPLTGARLTGLNALNGVHYYFSEDGIMQTGLIRLDYHLYYFAETGEQQFGWQEADGKVYYLRVDAVCPHGLQQIDGNLYYFDAEGARYSGSLQLGKITYYFDENGIECSGWQDTADGRIYIDPQTGNRLTGWQTLSGKQYYFSAAGIMATGVLTIDGKSCKFGNDGVYIPVTICLDAGHYGKYNPSPVNSAYWESDFTWKMHLYLKDALEDYGIAVITTREDKDTDRGLVDRGMASAGCDLFLSIHSNATSNNYSDGPLACCQISGVADELGLALANTVHEVMGTKQGGSIWKRVGDNGDWYGVLRGAAAVGTPGILLEHSYHTTLWATQWLMVDANLERMAAAEAETIARYFGLIT